MLRTTSTSHSHQSEIQISRLDRGPPERNCMTAYSVATGFGKKRRDTGVKRRRSAIHSMSDWGSIDHIVNQIEICINSHACRMSERLPAHPQHARLVVYIIASTGVRSSRSPPGGAQASATGGSMPPARAIATWLSSSADPNPNPIGKAMILTWSGAGYASHPRRKQPRAARQVRNSRPNSNPSPSPNSNPSPSPNSNPNPPLLGQLC